MMLGELLERLRAFEDAHGGRQALREERVHIVINGEPEPLQAYLEIGGSHGVVIAGERCRTSSFESNHALLSLWLIRFDEPRETSWGKFWDSIDLAWSEAAIGRAERAEAGRMIPVGASIHYDRDCFYDAVHVTRELPRPLEDACLRMGEQGIELQLRYDRTRERERIRIH